MNASIGRNGCRALLLAVGLAAPSIANAQASVLYFWNPISNPNTLYFSQGSLTILGLNTSAAWTLSDITTLPPATVATGTAGSYSAVSVPASTFTPDHYYKLTANVRINAFFGGDCCGYYGSFQVPSNEDASRRVGKSFTLWAPVMNSSTETWVFSREAGTVTVTGGLLGANGISHTFTASQQGWKLPSCQNAAKAGGDTLCNRNGILDEKVFYQITSTGLISVEQSVNNGMATIPTASGWDVGPWGMFDIHANFQGAYAIYGYQDGTQFAVQQILPDGGMVLIADGGINFGEAFYMDGHHTPPGDLSPFRYLVTTNNGRISLWGGDTQNTFDGAGTSGAPGQCSSTPYPDGGVSPEAETLDCMGDDITFDVGAISSIGSTIIVNTRSMGANVFAPFDDTSVAVSGDITESTVLGADQTLYLAPWSQVTIVTNQPVMVQTSGGDHLDDWGKYLVQIPGTGNAPAAPVIVGPACTSTTTFDLVGYAPGSSQVTLFDDLTVPVAGSPFTASDAGNWSFTITLPNIADAGYSYFANDAVLGIPSAPTAPFTVTYLPNPPSPATITSPASGALLNTRNPTVAGTADPNDTVSLTVSLQSASGTTLLDTYSSIPVSLSGTFSFTIPDPLADTAAGAAYVFQVADVDCAGSASSAVASSVTLDATPPTPPVINVPSGDGGTEVSATMLVSGTAQPGTTVTLTFTDSSGGTFTTTVTTSSTGSWQFLGATGLPDGTVTVTGTATDLAGLTSAPSTATVLLDTNPAVETTPPSGSTLNSIDPTLGGTNPPGALVYISVNGGPEQLATVSGGTWSLPTTLGPGTYTVTVFTGDSTGGSSGPTTATFTINTSPVVITGPANGSDLPAGPVTVSGTAAPGTTIQLSVNGATQTVAVDASGNWSVTVAAPTGSYAVTATDIDSEGNVGPSASITFNTSTSGTTGGSSSASSGAGGSSGSNTNGSGGTNASNGTGGSSGTNASNGTVGSNRTGTNASNGTNSTGGTNASTGNGGSNASNGTGGSNGNGTSSGTNATGGSNASNASGGSNGTGASNGGTNASNGTGGSDGTSASNGTGGTAGSNGTNASNGGSGSNGTNASNGGSGSNGTNASNGGSGSNGTNASNGGSGSNGTNASNGGSGSNGTNASNGGSGSNGTNASNGGSGSNGTNASNATGGTGDSNGSSGSGSHGSDGSNGSGTGGTTIGGSSGGTNESGASSTGSTHVATGSGGTSTSAPHGGTNEGTSGNASTEAAAGSTGSSSNGDAAAKARGCSSAGGGFEAFWIAAPMIWSLGRRNRRSNRRSGALGGTGR